MDTLTSDDASALLTKADGRVYVIAYIQRAALLSYVAAIEWYWYSPHTDRNRFFDVYGCKWEGGTFIIAAFPEGRLQAAMRLATQLGLRLVSGVPGMLGDGASMLRVMVTSRPSKKLPDIPIRLFPGAALANGSDNPAVYTVEYDTNHPAYKNRKNDEAAMKAADSKINDLLNRGVRLDPDQIADYIFGTGPFPNIPE